MFPLRASWPPLNDFQAINQSDDENAGAAGRAPRGVRRPVLRTGTDTDVRGRISGPGPADPRMDAHVATRQTRADEKFYQRVLHAAVVEPTQVAR
ncbi:unnamed protein product [Caenorhabditis auriculariae]|uniref:Uncharacterized protein n=1 Tax=Caenorhabditis auriculariae TaxID=2777116 RepID=A0A8S1GSZ5_9PELO|nr:unnamed protein product [Caenorhabditis auriculariae]